MACQHVRIGDTHAIVCGPAKRCKCGRRATQGRGCVDQDNNVFHAPEPIGQASRHRGRDFQRLVDAAEIIPDGIERHHVAVVLELLGKGVREARETRMNPKSNLRLSPPFAITNLHRRPGAANTPSCRASVSGPHVHRPVLWT